MELILEDWFALCTIILVFIWGIAIFLFGRISVKHIEQEMVKEGKFPPEWDKCIGGRNIAYAMEIVLHRFFSKKHRMGIIDIEATLRHARKKDWYLAFFLLVSFSALILTVSLAYYLYAP